MCNFRKLIAFLFLYALVVITVNGCTYMPHNDVLIFATQTSFGVDVSASPTSQSPRLALGYKRDEGVWMPLIVNGRHVDKSNIIAGCEEVDPAVILDSACQPIVVDDLKYIGRSKGIPTVGGGVDKVIEEDTYSVFASFGGKASGSKDGAGLAVAQFFATGIAAQRLGRNQNAYKLVSTEDVNAATRNEAIKRADAEEKRADILEGLLTDEERKGGNEEGEKYYLTEKEAKEAIITHLEAADNFSTELSVIVDNAVATQGLNEENGEDIKRATNRAELESVLRIYRGAIVRLYAVLPQE